MRRSSVWSLLLAVSLVLASCGGDAGTQLGADRPPEEGEAGLADASGSVAAETTTVSIPWGYGDDENFDRAWDLCAQENWDACDELWWNSPPGSEYAAFSGTCGYKTEGGEWCVYVMGGAEPPAAVADPPDAGAAPAPVPGGGPPIGAPKPPDPGGFVPPAANPAAPQPGNPAAPQPGNPPGGDPFTYGDDQTLDALWDACGAGDPVACDELYLRAPFGSDYEAYGVTCANRVVDSQGDCANALAAAPGAVPAPGDPNTYGDDAVLDGLWDACSTGDWASCDKLFVDSPANSHYQAWGFTCGNRIAHSSGDCVAAGAAAAPSPGDPFDYGDDAYLDSQWDGCAIEDWSACDRLASDGLPGSNYRSYGETCGNRDPNPDLSKTCRARMLYEYGDNPHFDALYDRCSQHDWQACDQLAGAAPEGSLYRGWGLYCGAEWIQTPTDPGENCWESLGQAFNYGDSSTFDRYYEICLNMEGGYAWPGFCDFLYETAPDGSQYEQVGGSCGNRVDAFGTCSVEFWSSDLNDLMWLCDRGDWWKCDSLFTLAPGGSYYEWFGLTCGGGDVPPDGKCP